MQRHTKIVATLGPSSNDPETLERMIRAGVDVVRLNFSHGKAEDHMNRANIVREAAKRVGKPVAILADLQGPKIRVGKFANGKTFLEKGQSFILDASCELGDDERVGLDYKELPNDVKPGTILLLNDGAIVLDVEKVVGPEIHTRVRHGGELSNNKGINQKGGGLTAPALTAKDMEDLKTAAAIGIEYVAVSFPKNSADMYMARTLLRAAGSNALTIAKIERTEAVEPETLREILEASDGLMVARGDLAVEVGEAAVPALQKKMIKLAREMNKLAITATQMMESMISSPVPTRAEVSDVANAVLDGTDAVMLSAETAAGKFPVEVVETMARVCEEAEKSSNPALDQDFLNRTYNRIDQSIAMAALFTAHHMGAKAIVALTESGSTALWTSRVRSGMPIYALTSRPETVSKTALYCGVHPFSMPRITDSRDNLLHEAELTLLRHKLVQPGDIVVITVGEPLGQAGGTNSLKIVKIGS
ncbi:MAG: pyruvate kinase [Candidatus Dactylopiibacterium carminicum]|uniref:Pyruvate kinase n=1 Tax=Candidatus Dactylopiibacterium carminicum TaxID=857335 RepID=A0A272EN19_9RHOO|nr:pyruvate kinase [Candidatus Dactylopiibacterium carminicum]KAF7597875.1 pyruvate kinase [Candidatus Dactylopiibacterium carminicum]PAS91466.1 MAG: pyruvate kinase [Candidatus Dactylopiibacterium carminicum]PAS95822.1 MAG: pyruvate kinase [Candidatus Dactylopiibacterium carminicum]